VGLGFALLVDLLSRVRDFRAHYTIFGGVPPAPKSGFLLRYWLQPFLDVSWIQGSVFFFGALAAVAVMVGYKTRLATVLGWGLLYVIQLRNPLVSQGGDLLLRLLYFWAIFLPLGARFSFDAAVDQTPEEDSPSAYFSMGTVAILLQVGCLYFFSAFLKSGPEWIPDGTALYYALHLESLVHPFGKWLREYQVVLQGLTYFTSVLEVIGPLLLFSPWFFLPLRITFVLLFALFHLGIVVCMNVGLFPLMNFVSLLPFLPSWCWDKLTPRLQKSSQHGLTIFYDEDCDFCRKICLVLKTFLVLPLTPILPAQSNPFIYEMMEREKSWVVRDHLGQPHREWDAVLLLIRHSPIFSGFGTLLSFSLFHGIGTRVYQFVASHRGVLGGFFRLLLPYRRLKQNLPRPVEVVVGLLALYMVFINISTSPILPTQIPDQFSIVKRALMINQKWNMFAPHPRKDDGWVVISGRLINGTDVDVYNLRSTRPVFEDSSFDQYPYANYRWRKYLTQLVNKKGKYARPYYGKYLCNLWNESHPPLQQLHFLEMYFFKVHTPPPDSTQPAEPKPFLILEHSCLKTSS
jgi:predicted DCC family thiol-disulfide oxidoreductase YuxK